MSEMVEWVTISLPWPSPEGWHYLQGLLAVWLLAGSIAVPLLAASMAIEEMREASIAIRLRAMGHRGFHLKARSTFSSSKLGEELRLWGMCLVLGPVTLVFGGLWLLLLVATSEEKAMAGTVRRRREWLDNYMGRRA